MRAQYITNSGRADFWSEKGLIQFDSITQHRFEYICSILMAYGYLESKRIDIVTFNQNK